MMARLFLHNPRRLMMLRDRRRKAWGVVNVAALIGLVLYVGDYLIAQLH